MQFLELTLGTPLGAGLDVTGPPSRGDREAIERASQVSVDHTKRSFLASSHLSDSSHVTHMSHILLILTKKKIFVLRHKASEGRSVGLADVDVEFKRFVAGDLSSHDGSPPPPPPPPPPRCFCDHHYHKPMPFTYTHA